MRAGHYSDAAEGDTLSQYVDRIFRTYLERRLQEEAERSLAMSDGSNLRGIVTA